ncbi:MAG: hypothetical protein M3O70_28235 [Actinomycetota bacterium]|nr:hypothetical protein [Actinomycetota bacterium]
MAEKRLLELLLPAVVLGILLCAPVQAGGSSAPGELFVSRQSSQALVEWYQPDGTRIGQLKAGKLDVQAGSGSIPRGTATSPTSVKAWS